jgi:hypothetical protein
MPMQFKKAAQTDSTEEGETADPQTRYAFRFRTYWFVLAQTEGEETYVAPIPGFDTDTALHTLNITRTPFEEINGNIQGFAKQREIAVNPLAAFPHKTTFHELAHIVLGHTTTERLVDGEKTAVHIREVEAESVALICCETLGLEGAEFCRGYIQHWLKTEKEIPNHSAARIFAAATSILKAGTPAPCLLLKSVARRTRRMSQFKIKGEKEMSTTEETKATQEYRNIPIAQLKESSTNPRKTFDEGRLAELAESIRSKGVLSPLLARKVNGHFEIVSGARRYRAAQRAGVPEIPVRIVDLTDAEVIETQIVELSIVRKRFSALLVVPHVVYM